MLQIHVNGIDVTGLSAPISQAELMLQPIMHDSGAAWWVIDASGVPFTDSSGTEFFIRQRTESECRNTPEVRQERAKTYTHSERATLFLAPRATITYNMGELFNVEHSRQ